MNPECRVGSRRFSPTRRPPSSFMGACSAGSLISPGPVPDARGLQYLVAQIRGRDVAGLASQGVGASTPVWNTFVSVASADDVAKNAIDAGGRVFVAPVDVNPAGRMAVLADPSGASIGVWEPRERQGAQRINEVGAWSMSSLLTRRYPYRDYFLSSGLLLACGAIDAGGADAVLLRLPGYVGGLPEQPVPRDVVAVAMHDGRLKADRWSVDFWIDDVENAVKRGVEAGASVIKPPVRVRNVPSGRYCGFRWRGVHH